MSFSLNFSWAAPAVPDYQPKFLSCDPVSEVMGASSSELSSQFCSQWNPDFSHNHQQCCSPLPVRRRKGRIKACSQKRVIKGFCSEMTQEQKDYVEAGALGKQPDLLSVLMDQSSRRSDQAFCTVNNGFLANGRPVIPTSQNRIMIQSLDRCTYFGTDAMVGMLEWLGRETGKNFSSDEYSRNHILVGDIAGPRGGCLFGRSGKRRHASHTTGQDADIGFLNFHPHQVSPGQFQRTFDVEKNWWFLKKILKNPYACVKVIFLGREHIAKLKHHFSRIDPEWVVFHRFIRHMPGHSNHFHVRIGMGPGPLGCRSEAHPELEPEEDGDSVENNELSILWEIDKLKTRQSSSVEK